MRAGGGVADDAGGGVGMGEGTRTPTIASATTNQRRHLHDLPDVILTNIFAMVSDVRSRNSMSLACHRWYALERSTRTSLSLRGNARDLFLLPNSFSSVSHLDLSLLSPWGHPLPHLSSHSSDFQFDDSQELVAHRLRQAFPNLTSLSVYARSPSTLRSLAPHWPSLRHVSLVRWHRRPTLDPPGSDLEPLFASCPLLTSLDLSRFYFWPEDIPAALQAYPSAAASLSSIDLLSSSLTDGFRSSELVAVSAACPNLSRLRAPCVFNPMHFNFVGGDTLLALASNCPGLSLLHLVDPAAAQPNSDAQLADASISVSALEGFFIALPRLEDLVLDLCQNVGDAGRALEVLGNKCPRIKNLKLGNFQGVCKAAGLHLDGVAVCGGLQSLSIKNSVYLTDSSLVAIARGCPRLARFEVHGCHCITDTGISRLAGMLRHILVDVSISDCQWLNTAYALHALAPIRDRIQRLHIDCVWDVVLKVHSQIMADDDDEFGDFEPTEEAESSVTAKKRRCPDQSARNHINRSLDGFWCRSWSQLRHLSLWLPAGGVLSPLPAAGLEDCPELEEICIKIEGDCRTCPRPYQSVLGLSCLVIYPQLSKMKLNCGDAIGYALTAPMGHMDLSLWERFYLHGIGTLSELRELDYWPPHDREVNQRSLSLPAAGLIQGCLGLRKLFIHGTTHEHFMRFFLALPGLRDVQLREDYYPAPENDMSTEMRVDSCSRFEDALNSREIPD